MLVVLLALLALAAPAAARPAVDVPGESYGAAISWRTSKAVGRPYAGRLIRGVQFPAQGFDFVTWDPILKRSPNRGWRRWGTDGLVLTVLQVLREYRDAHPDAARVLVGDLSRPHGGPFGARYGGLGHSSHQNGLDVDVYYPRRDGLELQAFQPSEVDPGLSQDLVDRFVDAGAVGIYTGPHLKLRGPRRIVSKLVNHDDHLHIRLPRSAE